MMTKPTWVFVAGTYRSGSTTQYQMIRDIVEQTDNGIGIGYHTEAKLKDFDTHSNKFVVCKVFEPLFIGFRNEPSYAKRFFDEGRVLAVVTIRDPRDIIVSMKKRAEGRKQNGQEKEWDFSETATTNFPIWLGWLEKWIDLGTEITLVSSFEEMTENLYREAKRIAEHLEIDITADHAGKIAKKYRISEIMKRQRKHKISGEKQDLWLPQIPAIAFGTSRHYRTWLSQPEVKMVEIANHNFMKRFGYL